MVRTPEGGKRYDSKNKVVRKLTDAAICGIAISSESCRCRVCNVCTQIACHKYQGVTFLDILPDQILHQGHSVSLILSLGLADQSRKIVKAQWGKSRLCDIDANSVWTKFVLLATVAWSWISQERVGVLQWIQNSHLRRTDDVFKIFAGLCFLEGNLSGTCEGGSPSAKQRFLCRLWVLVRNEFQLQRYLCSPNLVHTIGRSHGDV